MSLTELLPTVKLLPHADKLRLMQFLVTDLAQEEVVPLQAANEEDRDDVTDAELAAEDVIWEAAMARHADKFTALKARAKADMQAGKSQPMFDERGEFIVE